MISQHKRPLLTIGENVVKIRVSDVFRSFFSRVKGFFAPHLLTDMLPPCLPERFPVSPSVGFRNVWIPVISPNI